MFDIIASALQVGYSPSLSCDAQQEQDSAALFKSPTSISHRQQWLRPSLTSGLPAFGANSSQPYGNLSRSASYHFYQQWQQQQQYQEGLSGVKSEPVSPTREILGKHSDTDYSLLALRPTLTFVDNGFDTGHAASLLTSDKSSLVGRALFGQEGVNDLAMLAGNTTAKRSRMTSEVWAPC